MIYKGTLWYLVGHSFLVVRPLNMRESMAQSLNLFERVGSGVFKLIQTI
jgi:hypothetical protein